MNEILLNVISVLITSVVIPSIVFLGTKLNAYLKTKIENEQAQKYLQQATDAVTIAVTSTLQTYVDSLKKSGSFDLEAQTIAFNLAKDKAISLIKDDVKEMIIKEFGNFDAWLVNMIETKVNSLK